MLRKVKDDTLRLVIGGDGEAVAVAADLKIVDDISQHQSFTILPIPLKGNVFPIANSVMLLSGGFDHMKDALTG